MYVLLTVMDLIFPFSNTYVCVCVCVCVCLCLEMIIFYLKFKHIVSLANTMPCLQQRCLFIYFFKVMGFGMIGVLPLSQILTAFLKNWKTFYPKIKYPVNL